MANIKTYVAKQGQSIFDICLQTYGDLNLIYKLIQDNGIESILTAGFSGMSFNYDASLISDNSIVTQNISSPYITDTNANMAGAGEGSFNDDFSDDFDN